jgi:Methyltransferase domain
MFPYPIQDNVFRIDDVEFHIDMSRGKRRNSEPGSFTIVKDLPYLNIYAALSRTLKPASILELGIFQGGSFVLLDKLFQPARMSALDAAKEPVEALTKYASSRKNRYTHFATSQTNAVALESIVTHELGGSVDLVVDDASHTYEATRRSFELLYPRLSPGGTYIIEDWAWSHMSPYQGVDALWAEKPALTNFIFDLIQLQGSTAYISELRVLKPLVIVRKPSKPFALPAQFLSEVRNRGKTLNQI